MSTTETISLTRNLPKRKKVSQTVATDYAFIKKLIWVYFILLLFEGALRKWFLPGLSQGLLIIRDPIVIWIYYLAYNQGFFPTRNKYIQKCFIWVIAAALISLIVSKTHPLTIVYGARTNFLHFPLIFIIARVLSFDDVMQYGKAFLILALPMTWVVAQQFQADRFDVMNVGAGGTGHQLMTSGDKVRASGTFSFVSGIVFYYCFTVSFIMYGFIVKTAFPKWMLYLGTIASLLAMVTAGSRAVIAECLQVVACIGFLVYLRPNEFYKISGSVLLFILFALTLNSQVGLFQEGLEFLSLRFEEASNVEGTPLEAYFKRYYDIIIAPFSYAAWVDILGNGLGTATRAGAALGGTYGFSEVSWARPVLENGIFIGLFYIIWRVWITKDLLVVCLRSIKKGSYLCIFLFGASGPIILFAPFGQPTNLGFAAFGAGLCLASTKQIIRT